MDLVDVIFPQKIGLLTYRVPQEMRELMRPGLMVEADVRKHIKRGIVAGSPPEGFRLPGSGTLKELSGIVHDQPSLSRTLAELVLWVSRYYVCREGLTLRGVFPAELFEPVKQRGTGKVREPLVPYSSGKIDERLAGQLEILRAGQASGGYGCYLHHASSSAEEFSFLFEALRGKENVIIVCPDKQTVAHLVPALETLVGERLVEYHSGLSKGRRSEALAKIASGLGDIVIGSLSAVFAPMPRVSMIAVLSEESTLYKAEGSPRYNARDVAVMRAYKEGATALLSSICPSVESWHNAATGRYTLLDTATGAPRPAVRIVNAWGQNRAISDTLATAVQKAMSKGGKVLLYLNRKGYSMLRCDGCGHLERCPKCDIPMVYHKHEGGLRCGYCGMQGKLYDHCPSCGGADVSLSGMGLERIEDELKDFSPVGVDSLRRDNLSIIAGDDGASLGVGTKTLTRTAALGGSALISGVLNADAMLNTPDFRSRERAFQDIMYAVDMASPEGGQLIVQTRLPGLEIYACLRRFNFRKFYELEFKERREAAYPPFGSLAVIDIRSDKLLEPPEVDISGVEVLGPVPVRLRKSRRGRGAEAHGQRLLLKAPTREALHRAIELIVKGLPAQDLDVDVDPLSF